MPIRRVLVANRGEIAVRIIRACRDLGIETVQVFSTADRDSLAVRLADHSVCIGGATAAESYLSAKTLVEAAVMTNADAVHPGYGFLSENAEFAELCVKAGLIFIGPSAAVIRLMGDKAAARRAAMTAGIPVTPGSPNPISDPSEAIDIAARIGYPVLIKASAGGGGRGMRVVESEAALADMLARASAEAASAFGSGEVYIEKYLPRVRHVEVQVMGDGAHVIHFGERDCSVQRRHQKLVEESPSSAISPALRDQITGAACRLAQRVGYSGAGTIEFIVVPDSDTFYFIEMNTRIQVEHPVTELVTGTDLVAMQIIIAATGELPIDQSAVQFCGHAIECRINAEDPERGFMPRPGRLAVFNAPSGPGVRVDTHVYAGYDLPPYYELVDGQGHRLGTHARPGPGAHAARACRDRRRGRAVHRRLPSPLVVRAGVHRGNGAHSFHSRDDVGGPSHATYALRSGLIMAFEAKLDEFDRRRRTALGMGGEEKLRKRRSQGVLNARERLDALLDKDTFIESGLFATSHRPEMRERTPADGKIAGFGRIGGRGVARRVERLHGAWRLELPSSTARRSATCARPRRNRGMPLVFLGESTGARMPDRMGAAGRAMLGQDPAEYQRLRQTPWSSALLGACYGSSTWYACMSDFVVMRKGATMAVASSRRDVAGDQPADRRRGTGRLEAARRGDRPASTPAVDTDEEALAAVRRFLGYLPSHRDAGAARACRPRRGSTERGAGHPGPPARRTRHKVYDVRKIVAAIADRDSVFELKAALRQVDRHRLTRLDGHSVGVIANNPHVQGRRDRRRRLRQGDRASWCCATASTSRSCSWSTSRAS